MTFPGLEVDRSSPEPLRSQLYRLIRQEFLSIYRPGDLLPTEMDLSRRFRVGRGTIRNALEDLTTEGLIERVAGRGSFLRADAVIRSRAYRAAVVLSRAEFAPGHLREETWVHHLEMLNGMLGAQAQSNLTLVLVDEDAFDPAAEASVDGVILFRHLEPSLVDRLSRPSVVVHYEVDLVLGFGGLVSEALAAGYRRPVFLGDPGKGRLDSINRVLTQFGRDPLGPDRVFLCGGTEADGARAAKTCLDSGLAPDCFLCSTDLRALGVLATLEARGGAGTPSIGVYGFDGIRRAALSKPPLTTWAFDWTLPGAFAVQELRALLDGRPRPQYTVPSGHLVVRASTHSSP